jgi:hypothetical protein
MDKNPELEQANRQRLTVLTKADLEMVSGGVWETLPSIPAGETMPLAT